MDTLVGRNIVRTRASITKRIKDESLVKKEIDSFLKPKVDIA